MPTETIQWPDRMNPTDAVFWVMDKIPELRSTIGALVLLKHAPSPERIYAAFDRLTRQVWRMRQRVVEVPFMLAPPEWVDDPQFDLDYHLRHVAVPAPGGMDELLAEMSPLYATAFDHERPLWEAYVTDGMTGGRGAVFVKMHHCLTDGVGGSRLFAELLGEPTTPHAVVPPRAVRVRQTTPGAMLWRAAWDNGGEALRTSVAVARAMVSGALNPRAAMDGTWRGLQAVVGFGRELLLRRAQSPLRHQRSLSRRLATYEMPLADLDAARKRLQATNNDTVLTIVAGAMHRWHASHGSNVRELRAMVPVSLRGSEEMSAGNRLALLAINLPVGELDPLRRLRLIQDRMGRVKQDRRASLYPLLARVMSVMPLALAKQLGDQQTRRTNFVCTNVPGPQRICYLAGEPIEKIYPYAPLVGDHPVAIALYSYRDLMCVGLDVDPLAMDDLPQFRRALAESYAEVLNVGRRDARPSPWRPTRHDQPTHPARVRQRATA